MEDLARNVGEQLEDVGNRESERVLLLIEEESRFGDGGILLLGNDVPQDGLSRVIANYETAYEAGGGLERQGCASSESEFSYHRFILRLFQELQPGRRVWCAGEFDTSRCSGFVELLRKTESAVAKSTGDALAAFVIDAELIEETHSFPWYGGDFSLRYFGFERSQTHPLELELRVIAEKLKNDDPAATTHWATLRANTYDRAILRSWCELDCICVLPDGPYLNEVGIHMNHRLLGPVKDAIERVVARDGTALTTFTEFEEWLR